MNYKKLNDWNLTPAEAIAVQNQLRELVVVRDDFGDIKTVAGVDVGFNPSKGTATGGVVVLTYPDLEIVETATATEPVTFPYIPGLLSFREMPAILAAFKLLETEPDMIMVDGMGLAHPRRFGIACHLGLLLDRPSIGCGKSKLIGSYEEPGPNPGDNSPLLTAEGRIGTVLRTKLNTNPLFISPGHRISIESSDRFVLDCGRGYRLPQTTRLAHELVSRARPDSK